MVAEAWRLGEPAADIALYVSPVALCLRSGSLDLSAARDLQRLQPKSRLGSLLPALIPQLLEMQLATTEGGAIAIDHHDLVILEELSIDAFEEIAPWAPFTLELTSTGWLRDQSFRYLTRFYLGAQVIAFERYGAFVKSEGSVYRLDKHTFLLLDQIDSFNNASPAEKVSRDAFIKFAEIKGLAASVGAELDRYLSQERILVPPKVGLDIKREETGRITFVPTVQGVPEDALHQTFLASDDVDDAFVCHVGGEKVRVVLTDAHREVIRRMQKVRRLGGVERTEVLRNPNAVFDGVSAAVEIDYAKFGPRIKGIGDFPFATQPYVQHSATGIFDDVFGPGGTTNPRKVSAGLRCSYVDGTSEDVEFRSREELQQLFSDAQNAYKSGKSEVQFREKLIKVDHPLIEGLRQLEQTITSKSRGQEHTKAQNRKYLLIFTNESAVEYEEEYSGKGGDSDLEIPQALDVRTKLKPHQRAGVAWLQRNYRLGRHGCLLADDMGLGKTLQVLTFLAWVIEKGDISPAGTDSNKPPWNPILIVAPVILLENEIWLNDMRRFFDGEGAIFQPWITLHGKELQFMRRGTGSELSLGEPVLDLDRLREHRVILTNYDTVTNYQYSLAQLRDGLSIVITDEAQEHKTPNTKISHALKSLMPRFRVSCTGTPVETRLLDVWNIFDFLQPGSLLGSSRDFCRQFEPSGQQQTAVPSESTISALRTRLLFGEPDAFVLRRDKTGLDGLPKKIEHTVKCHLSDEQRRWHIDLVSRARSGGEDSHPFALIHHLMRLYQHPALVPRFEPTSVHDCIERSPKLKAVVDLLGQIRHKNEKALIFTRTLDMQQILKIVIQETFHLDVDVINGSTARPANSQSHSRQAIVRRFRESEGFNALILSPDVAGLGLTLIEANHVIHYGRWWNPAKESQATDRTYRIGQERDVHVYYLIAHDPANQFETFDQKLDALIQRRKSMAGDFLAPMASDKDVESELLSEIIAEPQAAKPETLKTSDISLLTEDRFVALAALLLERSGARVILTPRSGNEGIDVIAVKNDVIELIQCRQSKSGAPNRSDHADGLLSALNAYRSRRMRNLAARFAIKGVLVTDRHLTKSERAYASEFDLICVDRDPLIQLFERYQFTAVDVEAMNSQREPSMPAVQNVLNTL